MVLMGYVPVYGANYAIPYFESVNSETDELLNWWNTNGSNFKSQSELVGSEVMTFEELESLGFSKYSPVGVFAIQGTSYTKLSELLKAKIIAKNGDCVAGLSDFVIHSEIYGENVRYGTQSGYIEMANGFILTPVNIDNPENKYFLSYLSDDSEKKVRLGSFDGVSVKTGSSSKLKNGANFTANELEYFSTISEAITESNRPLAPDRIIIRPSIPITSKNSKIQFTGKYIYNDGTELNVDVGMGKWSVEDIGNSTISISDSGLLVIGDNVSVSRFSVKLTWEGFSYSKSISTTVFISSGENNNAPYTPGIGGGSFPSWTGGGGGNFGVVDGTPETSDPIEPLLPGIGTPSGSVEGSVSNAGLFVHYAMNGILLKTIGDWLWASDLGLVIAKEFISLLYGSPIESAISLMSYPFDIKLLHGVQINSQEIYWGGHASGVTAPAITNPYATIDWGTIQLTEFWGNFLDYAPHTKLELYLPWCTGFVPIDPNECLPGTLRVVTNIELAKGTCLHNVIGNDGRVIATHAGTCGKQLPLTALDTSGKALSLVSSAVSMAVAGGAGAAAQSAGIDAANAYRKANPMPMTPSGNAKWQRGMEMAVHSASAPHERRAARAKNMALAGSAAATRTPSHVQRSGSFSGSTAGLGVQFPYLIISRPTQSVPAQYGHHYGYPSNIYTPLAYLRGYTEVGEIHLTGFVCTEEELEEIDSILKGGVIL